jgi:eukaryotic-like serine/threonine-protein kinase
LTCDPGGWGGLEELQSGDPQRVGPYALEGRLGAGGMGHVYLGRSPGGRHVAIKVIRLELAEDAEFRARFAREVAAARKVSGIYTAPVVDADADGPVPWLATSYVAGPSLAQAVDASGPLPAASVLRLAAGLAEGLAAIHSAGVIHRDVKPSNVLMAEDGPRLVDFGISRSMESDSLTGPGMMIGSPGFMAPEQAEGLEVGPPGDIFGLGAVLTFAATGKGPFGDGTAVVLIYRVVHSEPDTSGLPAEIRPLVERCLEKNPGRRPTAAELLGELSAIPAEALSGTRVPAFPAQTPAAADMQRSTAWREPPSLAASAAEQPTYAGPSPAQSSDGAPAGAALGYGARATAARGSLLNVPLKPSFRYIHEPVSDNEVALPSLGDDSLLTELQNRILHSRGGTFLITGFRGVGKSTLVLRALDQMVTRSTSSDLVLPVSLSVARSTTTERLLFAVVRRVFETLSDSGVLNKLPPDTRHALLVAYMRTSLSFKETQAEARERSATMGLGVGSDKGARALTNLVIPNLSISAKRSQSLATEASFLAYSETDVEHDLMRIVALVDREGGIPIAQPSRLRRLWPWSRHERSRFHLLIILDEVDKLTVDEEGIAAVESLLAGIKNVLTMSGAHFLLVAGPDLHDRAVRDAARGNGIYESVFGWRMYVPCSWDAPDKLVAEMVSEEARVNKKDLQLLVQYLRFKARGVLRRLLQEFNDFIVWDGESDIPHLRISAEDMSRVKFYARLEEILRQYFEKGERRRLFPVAIDEDRWRLGSYYVMDWVLRSEGKPFSASELLREDGENDFDPLLHISRRNVDALLEHFAAHRVIDVIRELRAGATIFGDVPESGAKVYRLAEEVQHSLFGFALKHESERPAKNVTLAGRSNTHSVVGQIVGKHYALGDLIGQGGMGMVYKAIDITSGRSVAIKMLRTSLVSDSHGIARLRREAEITKGLKHPQIVRVIDLIEENETVALVMELVEGPTLAQVIGEQGPIREYKAAETGYRLADALQYLAERKVTRIDLKPSNIIMHPRRGPIIIDMGIARSEDLDALTAVGMVIGSPGFMSPEQVEGRDVDPRADIFVLGIVLYFCLTGKSPYGVGTAEAILYRTVYQRIDVTDLPISQEFRQVIARATALQIDERFPNATEFQEALESTPEWHSHRQTAPRPTPIIKVPEKRVYAWPPATGSTKATAGRIRRTAYGRAISRKNPGCIIFLLDRSDSMKSNWVNSRETLAQGAARVLDEILLEVLFASQGEPGKSRHYFDVGIFGYGIRPVAGGEGVEPAFGGKLAGQTLVTLPDLRDNPIAVREVPPMEVGAPPIRMPVWVEPAHGHGRPLCQAIAVAEARANEWASAHPDSFPPIIINITGGMATDSPYEGATLDEWAQRLTNIQTSDGRALFFNIFLSPAASDGVLFPVTNYGLPEPGPQLFRISSPLPPPMIANAQSIGTTVEPGARGFGFNADATMLIRFISIGTETENAPEAGRTTRDDVERQYYSPGL